MSYTPTRILVIDWKALNKPYPEAALHTIPGIAFDTPPEIVRTNTPYRCNQGKVEIAYASQDALLAAEKRATGEWVRAMKEVNPDIIMLDPLIEHSPHEGTSLVRRLRRNGFDGTPFVFVSNYLNDRTDEKLMRRMLREKGVVGAYCKYPSAPPLDALLRHIQESKETPPRSRRWLF